jgi:predicted DCC family thiol-disulfide oxidoreductase YuxK
VRALLIFDGDCGICTASVNVMRRWIRPNVDIEPFQWLELEQYGLTADECAQAVQFVLSNGQVISGSRAVMAMLRTAPQPWPIVGVIGDLPGIAWVIDRTYRWIAANRERLPGSTPACTAA